MSDQIPTGWFQTRLGEFMSFKNGVNADKSAYGKGAKFINVMDIFAAGFLAEDKIIGSVEVSEKQAREYSVVYGDILFNRTSETKEEIAYAAVYTDEKPILFGGFVIRGRQTKQLLDASFSGYCFNVYSLRKELVRRSQGVVRANIGQKDLNKISINVPPLEEQQVIARLLLKWDTAIEKTEALIAAKRKQFDWLTSKTINNAGYDRDHISTFIVEVSARNRGNDIDRVLSVTNYSGFVLPEKQFKRRVASTDLSNYKVVKRGEYAYNPSRINVGSIARLDNWVVGVLSPMYIVFKLDETKINADYFQHWLSSYEARQRIKISAQGSVRQTVGFDDLASILIPLPDLEEQSHITNLLNTSANEITILEEFTKKYRTQKRGLMQKLLTGEWRVKGVA